MIWPVLSKIRRDQVHTALIVTPDWPTQSWYTALKKMRIQNFSVSRISSSKLSLPGTSDRHPMGKKLKLQAVLCTGSRR